MKKSFAMAEIMELDFRNTEAVNGATFDATSGEMTMSLMCGNIFPHRIFKGMLKFDDEEEIIYGEED